MTVASQTTSHSFVSSGTLTPVSIPFPFAEATDVKAWKVVDGEEIALTYGSDYSVSGDGRAGSGEWTPLVAIVAGTAVRLRRQTALDQSYNPVPGIPVNSRAIEAALDDTVLKVQEVDRDQVDLSGRALQVARGETIGFLPDASARAGKLLGFDGSGDPVTSTIDDAIDAFEAGVADDIALAAGYADSTSANAIAVSLALGQVLAVQTAINDNAAVYAIYNTKAAADAALASIPADAVIHVANDEAKAGARTIYRKTGGALVFVNYANAYCPAFTFALRPDPALYFGIMPILLLDERTPNVVCYSDGTYWRRGDGLIARSNGVPYVYADAVAGNDANAGTSSGAPVKTYARMKAVVDALPVWRRSGLTWAFKNQATVASFTGMLNINHADYGGTACVNYGAGQYLPDHDASEVIPNASFTPHATIAGAYEVTLPVQPDTVAAEIPRVFRENLCLSYTATEAGTSKTGTFWHPSATDVSTLRYVINTGTDPRADGALYSYPRYTASIHAFNAPESTFTNQVGRKPYGSYGSFIPGGFDKLRVSHMNVTVHDGNTHNILARRNCLMVNCHAINWNAGWGGAGSTALIFFEQTPKVGDEWGAIACSAKMTINTAKPATAISAVTLGGVTTITTVEPHGLVNGDIIVPEACGGSTWLNGVWGRVTAATSTTFQINRYDPRTKTITNINSTGLAAWTSGGFVRLAPVDQSGGIGVYAHSGGRWWRGRVSRFSAQGLALACSHANCELMQYEDIRALQCSQAVKPGDAGNWSLDGLFMQNIPAIAGAIVGTSGGANDIIRLRNIDATLNGTGNFFIAHTGVNLTVEGYKPKGFASLLRITATGADVTWAGQESKPNPNMALLDQFWVTAASATIRSDCNDFGGDEIGAEVSASCGATGTFNAASGSTTVTLSGVTGFVSPGDAVTGTNIPSGATLVKQLSGTTGSGGNWEISAATTGAVAGGTAFTVTSKWLHIWSVTRGVLDNRILGWAISGPTLSGSPTVSTYPSGSPLDLTLRANQSDVLLTVAQQFAQQAVLIGKRLTFQAPGGSATQPFSAWQAAGYDLNSKQ